MPGKADRSPFVLPNCHIRQVSPNADTSVVPEVSPPILRIRSSPLIKSVFRLRKDVIAEFTPRIAVPRPRRPHWIVYTDAATNHPMLCALLFQGGRSSPDLQTACAARAPALWSYFFRFTALIYGLELLALVLFFEGRAAFLKGSCFWVYLDNNNFLASLVRGASNAGIIAIMAARFWQLVRRFDICVRFPRVRSDLNPADLPTLWGDLPFRPRFQKGFSSFRPLSARCRPAVAALSPPKPIRIRAIRTVRKSSRRMSRV